MHDALNPWWLPRIFQWVVGSLLVVCAFALPLSTSATDTLFPVVALLSLFVPVKEAPLWRRLIAHPVALLFIGFFVLSLIGVTYSIAPAHELWRGLFRTSCFLAAAFLMISLHGEHWQRWRRYAIDAFLLAMMITLVLSYVKYYFKHDLFHTRFDQGSVFKDHIIQNFLMAYASFILMYRWLNARRLRWFYGILILLMVYNVLFVSDGRSGYVIFAALLLYTSGLYFGWRGILGAFIALVALSTLAFSFSTEFKHRMISTINETQKYQQSHALTSMGIRIQSIKNAFQLIKQKPILGHGTGSFSAAYANLPREITQPTDILRTAYNSFINVGVELGLVGIAYIILLLLFQWKNSLYLDDEWRYLTRILLIGMVLGCLANAWLSDTTELHLFALFSGLGFSTLPLRLPKYEKIFTAQIR